MITIVSGAYGVEPNQYFGLSTDTKPVEGVGNASVFYEMDTKKMWLFDAENAVWHEQ